MNLLKKIVLSAGVLVTGVVAAQSGELSMKNMLKVGANVGYSVPSSNFGFAAGVDVAYQHLVTPHFGLGVATGYAYHSGKDNQANGITLKNNDAGLIPAAVLLRYYPKKDGVYFGADMGYGFIVYGSDYVASNSAIKRPDGGFYLKPELGYHNKKWNFFLHYQQIFTGNEGKIDNQEYRLGTLGAGVSYNIALGK